jgi:hypothetical protein
VGELVRRWLASRWIALGAAALAIALTLPSLGNGLGIDDHLYRARVVTDEWSACESARDLFMFADRARPEEVIAAMASGELSWWAAPDLQWRDFRPIAQLSLHAEFRLFGRGGVVWMHLHNVLWLAALVLVVAAFYRRMFGATWVAGLAAILYAIDDGHGFSVGWVANRCTLMATTLAIATLIVHDRWRRDRWRLGAVLAPLGLALTLLASEEGIAACGLIGAYTLVLDEAPWRKRAAVLAVYAAVVLAWYAAWKSMGYGIDGTGSYTDPIAHPGVFVWQTLQRIPILVHSELGALPADLWEVYFVRHGLTWLIVAAGTIFLAVLAYAFARLVRTDRIARFWALGFVFSLAFVCSAHPTDRHLLVVGVSGSALVARFIAAWLERRTAPALLPRGAGVIAAFFILVHVVLAPIALPIRARLPGAVSRGVERIDTLVPSDPALAKQDLVLVNVPFKYLCNFASVVRRSNGGVSPRRWRCLGISPDPVEVERTSDRTLVLRPEHGYLQYFEDRNVRALEIPFAAGDRVTLPDFTITVLRVTEDLRPAEVEYRFAVSLDDASLRWLVWQRGGYRPFVPPAIGARLVLPADRFAFGDLLAEQPP